MVAPVIITYGNDEQKQRFLPDILASNVWWCQGYSEPNAGSDLASLKTTAVREGNHYVVNGTKTWNTLGQYADWIFCLVRTDLTARKQEGISFLLVDMQTPGIKVSPIYLLDGTPEVNEVHFDNVRVPVENLIGEENKGWTYAKVLLTHERTNIAGVPRSKVRLEKLKASAAAAPDGQGGNLLQDPVFAHKIAETEIQILALEFAELRALAAVSVGKAPGPESSILKIVGTEAAQRIDQLAMELAALQGLPFVPEQFEAGFDGELIGAEGAASAMPTGPVPNTSPPSSPAPVKRGNSRLNGATVACDSARRRMASCTSARPMSVAPSDSSPLPNSSWPPSTTFPPPLITPCETASMGAPIVSKNPRCLRGPGMPADAGRFGMRSSYPDAVLAGIRSSYPVAIYNS
jgi:hypothetical protein